ncbi:MAG: hypothetical protein ABSF77_17795 [Spirochaetia bacterium]
MPADHVGDVIREHNTGPRPPAHDPEIIKSGDYYYLFATGRGIPMT